MKQKILLTADEGKILTNGSIYGRMIYLAENDSAENYYEITEEEYNAIMAEREKNLEQEENVEEKAENEVL